MVTKIISGNSIWGLLRYNFEKIEKEKAKVLFTTGLVATDSEGKPDMTMMLKSFQTYLKNNRRTEQPILHISLNPHPKDKVTDEQLIEIAQKYMQRLGYGDQPYVIFKHSDIKREHIHIVSLQTDKDGKKIKDSFRNQHSREITTALEKEYKLHPIDKKENTDEIICRVDYEKGNVKRQIGNVVKGLSESYRFHSLNEFRSLLNLYNVTFEEVKGEHNGKPYHGIVYFATDAKGNKVSLPFKSSLWKTIGAKKLEENAEKFKAEEKAKPGGKQRLKRIIAEAKKITASQEKFIKLLTSKNISVIFRTNEQGRIYGVTFVDHNDKRVYNGSLLGKDFSANAFHQFFTKGVPDSNVSKKRSIEPGYDLPPEHTANITDSFDFFDGIFDFSASLPSDEPDIYQPKKKKRKRRIS